MSARRVHCAFGTVAKRRDTGRAEVMALLAANFMPSLSVSRLRFTRTEVTVQKHR
jgi:hypothetical protein